MIEVFLNAADAQRWVDGCERLRGGYVHVLPNVITIPGQGSTWFIDAVCAPNFGELLVDSSGNPVGIDAYPRARIPVDVARAIGLADVPILTSAAGMDMGRPPEQPAAEPPPSVLDETPGFVQAIADVLAPPAESDSAERRRGEPEKTEPISPQMAAISLVALTGLAFFALRRGRR